MTNIKTYTAGIIAALGIAPASIGAVAPGYLGVRGLRSSLSSMRKTAGRF